MSSRPSFKDVQEEASRLADTAKDRASDAIEEVKVASNQLVDKVRDLIEEGNVRRISLRRGEKTLFEIPLTVGAGFGAAALLLNPMLAAVGAAAALVADVTLIIERDPEAVAKQALAEAQDEHVANVNTPEERRGPLATRKRRRHASRHGAQDDGPPVGRRRVSRGVPAARDPAAPLPKAEPPPEALRQRLDALAARYERPAFIGEDPISIPHAFESPADREVAGLFAAVLAWGRRSVMLAKLAELMERMDVAPARFVRTFDAGRDGHRLDGFKHRTFTSGDAVALVLALQAVLHQHGSVESLALAHLPPEASHVGPALQGLSETLLTIVPGTPTRLRKHLARPSTGSACKRLAMYLRWMVRPGPVDFGLWRGIAPAQRIPPLDVHTGRQARRLGLLDRSYDDWRAALALTAACRAMDPVDPARYDYALFGLGAYDGQPMPEDEAQPLAPEAPGAPVSGACHELGHRVPLLYTTSLSPDGHLPGDLPPPLPGRSGAVRRSGAARVRALSASASLTK